MNDLKKGDAIKMKGRVYRVYKIDKQSICLIGWHSKTCIKNDEFKKMEYVKL